MSNKTEKGTAAPSGAPETAIADMYGRVMAIQGLNLRKGPGRQFDIAGVLPIGATVVPITIPGDIEVPGWMPVTAEDGTTGWVDSSYLDFIFPAGG